jgi:hypothetical protein
LKSLEGGEGFGGGAELVEVVVDVRGLREEEGMGGKEAVGVGLWLVVRVVNGEGGEEMRNGVVRGGDRRGRGGPAFLVGYVK